MKCLTQRKNGYYYFRKVIPDDVRHHNSAREFLLSLKTKHEIEAIFKAKSLLELSNRLLISARETCSKIMYKNSNQSNSSDIILAFMANVSIGNMNIKLEGSLDEVTTAINNLSGNKAKNKSHELNDVVIPDSPFIFAYEDDFFKYMRSMNYSSKTIILYFQHFKELKFVLKDARLSDLKDKKFVSDFLKIIYQLPARYDRKSSLEEILNVGLSPRPYGSATGTVTAFKSYLNYLMFKNILEENPINATLIPKKKKSFDKTGYASFSLEDLKRIFSDDLLKYSRKYPERYWLQVLALFTGARLSELLQLQVTDVFFDTSVPYLSINVNGNKYVKNKSSIRDIPLHPKILALGFKDYVEKIKMCRWENLFYFMKQEGNLCNATSTSSALGLYLKKQCSDTSNSQRKVFHSYRHTFITELQRMQVPLEIRQSIAGHSSQCITIDVYGEKTRLETMLDYIKNVDFHIDIPKLPNTSLHVQMRKQRERKEKE